MRTRSLTKLRNSDSGMSNASATTTTDTAFPKAEFELKAMRVSLCVALRMASAHGKAMGESWRNLAWAAESLRGAGALIGARSANRYIA
jgi:hypothetical protein